MKYLLIIVFLCLLGTIYAEPFVSERVVGGIIARPAQFPSVVSIQRGLNGFWQHVCGGTIISTRTILSAALCFRTNLGGIFRVRAGVLDVNAHITDGQTVNVEKVIVHDNFEFPLTSVENIALVILSPPLLLTASIAPATLPAPNAVPPNHGVLVGWGSKSIYNHSVATGLHYATAPVLPLANCTVWWDVEFNVNMNFCTGDNGTHFIGACPGDLGTPIFVENTIIGTVSRFHQITCGISPTAYVRISMFIDWITNNRVDEIQPR